MPVCWAGLSVMPPPTPVSLARGCDRLYVTAKDPRGFPVRQARYDRAEDRGPHSGRRTRTSCSSLASLFLVGHPAGPSGPSGPGGRPGALPLFVLHLGQRVHRGHVAPRALARRSRLVPRSGLLQLSLLHREPLRADRSFPRMTVVAPAPAGHIADSDNVALALKRNHERLNVLRGCRVFEA